jgi:hypothetical protein
MPCSATIQNCLPMRPLPTGVPRGFPVLRPVVSEQLDRRVEYVFLQRMNNPMFHLRLHEPAYADLGSIFPENNPNHVRPMPSAMQRAIPAVIELTGYRATSARWSFSTMSQLLQWRDSPHEGMQTDQRARALKCTPR